jgi:small subunit ribosomal protein S5
LLEINVAQFASRNQAFADENPFQDQVVKVYRCSTVVKGGRRFSFAALVAVGSRNGQVGIGYGKANEVPPAVEKAIKDARKNVVTVNLSGTTIPHAVSGKFGATQVVLIPASEGTGVIAGAAARAVLELAGVHNVLTKVYGSTGAKNVVKATMNALQALCSREQIEKIRGVAIPAL